MSSSPTSQDHSTTSCASSFLTDTTSSSYLHERNAAFAQLRTAEPDSAVDLEGPSLKKGDWRAFSRVEARGVRWPEREGGVRRRSLVPEQEWVVEGVLWVAKSIEVIFCIPPHSTPRQAPLSLPSLTRSRRLSLPFTRSLSRSSTVSPPREQTLLGKLRALFSRSSGTVPTSAQAIERAPLVPAPNPFDALLLSIPFSNILSLRSESCPYPSSSAERLANVTNARAPCIELDTREEGRGEMTVGFVFLDALLAPEAQEFAELVEVGRRAS